MQTFSEWLKEQIEEKGTNPSRVAKSMGLHRRTVQRWTWGDGLPGLDALTGLAKALDLDAATAYSGFCALAMEGKPEAKWVKTAILMFGETPRADLALLLGIR